MPQLHALKIWPLYFAAIVTGEKTFEVRRNDRDFKVGDTLELLEYTPDDGYTGRSVMKTVGYICHFSDIGLPKEFIVMSLFPAKRLT